MCRCNQRNCIRFFSILSLWTIKIFWHSRFVFAWNSIVSWFQLCFFLREFVIFTMWLRRARYRVLKYNHTSFTRRFKTKIWLQVMVVLLGQMKERKFSREISNYVSLWKDTASKRKEPQIKFTHFEVCELSFVESTIVGLKVVGEEIGVKDGIWVGPIEGDTLGDTVGAQQKYK